MSLVTKDNLSLTLQVIKKFIFSELSTKIDRSEIEGSDAIKLAAELELVYPVASENGAFYTDENGVLYSL